MQTSEARKDTQSATVLVVDDNDANRLLARHALEDEGYRVILATGGAEGIAAFEREAPDCILLDVRMPDVDGFAVCETIRSRPRGSETPILFLTALRDVDTFERALRAGGDDFVTKPVSPAELVVRVHIALKLRRMGAELRAHFDLLKHQREEVMRLQLQKERLMAFVVHDLKNPVHTMDLHAQLMARDRSLPDSARDSVMHIRAQARQLGRMISNLLDLSKADEGKLTVRRSEVDLQSLVGEVVGELDVAARARKLTLEVSLTTDRLSCDEDLVRRTLANLVENAIHHAPPETAVRVTSADLDGATELRVADAGTGIPLEMRERVFLPFVQLAAGQVPDSRGGRGLGLSFCKLAVEAHGGRIWVDDAPGAVFCVWLPHE